MMCSIIDAAFCQTMVSVCKQHASMLAVEMHNTGICLQEVRYAAISGACAVMKKQEAEFMPERLCARILFIGVIVLLLVAPVHFPVPVGVHSPPILPLTQVSRLHKIPPLFILHRHNLHRDTPMLL